jgi:Tol biopolymer transport system component
MITGSSGPPGDNFYLVGVSDGLAIDLPMHALWEHEKHFVDPITLAWSPNGEWLATLGLDADISSWQDVWLYDPDTNQAKRVTSTRESSAYMYQSAWSANEEYLAIAYGLNPTGIMISRPDELSHIEISSRTHSALREWPYSFLATVQRSDGTQELDPRVYLQYYFIQSSRPVWVDQDQHIIFIAPASADRVALFVVNVDGTGLHELLPGLPGLVGLPTLAPDGQKLAFVRYPGWDIRDRAEIAVADLDAKAIISLVVLPAPSNGDELHISGLDWTPDGKYLAFSSNHQGQSDIYIISTDGEAWINLTDKDDGDAVNPIWRP